MANPPDTTIANEDINLICDPFALAAHVYLKYWEKEFPFALTSRNKINFLSDKFNIDKYEARRALDYLSKINIG